MKIRTDYVTNSSSSSFLLAFRKKNLTRQQKDAIVEYVLEHALGDLATDESLHEWYGDDYYGYGFDDEYSQVEEYDKDTDLGYAKCLQKDGWTVRIGRVSFDPAENKHAYFLQGLWQAIEDADPDNTELIDTDLSY